MRYKNSKKPITEIAAVKRFSPVSLLASRFEPRELQKWNQGTYYIQLYIEYKIQLCSTVKKKRKRLHNHYSLISVQMYKPQISHAPWKTVQEFFHKILWPWYIRLKYSKKYTKIKYRRLWWLYRAPCGISKLIVTIKHQRFASIYLIEMTWILPASGHLLNAIKVPQSS